MTPQFLSSLDVVFSGYVLAFGAAALICLLSINSIKQVEDPDTRRGLVALLLTSGGWALAHVGFLLAPTQPLKTAFYLGGLVIGFSAVGPWLYFCSAYTGRSLHRNRTIRRTAVAVFVIVVLVKITNPIHHLYFTTELLNRPFPHLAVQHQLLHWLVMGLSYTLASIGYFMLFERFMQISHSTRPLLGLVAITGLPLILDVIGYASPYFINITYEPLGVAVFALGIVFVYLDRLQAIQLVSAQDDPTIVLSDDSRIRDYNESATRLFPELSAADAIGNSLEETLPAIAESRRSNSFTLSLTQDGDVRYYHVAENQFTSGDTSLGYLLTLSDITDREQYRKQIERQKERLDEFASIVSHDLRNPLHMAEDWVELARNECDSEYLDEVEETHDRMHALIEDLLLLARQGQDIDSVEPVDVEGLARRCWQNVDTGHATLSVNSESVVQADESRLSQVFENIYRNAIEHAGTGSQQDATGTEQNELTITVGDLRDGFFIEDTGAGIPPSEREDVFEAGHSTEPNGTGLGLYIVREIVDAHGWEIAVTDGSDGGARFEITGVETT